MISRRLSVAILAFYMPLGLLIFGLGLYFTLGGPLFESRPAEPCLTDCYQPSNQLAAAFPGDDVCEDPSSEEKHVCLVLLGNLPVDLVQHLVAYYEKDYGLTVHVARTLSMDDVGLPSAGRQYGAEALRNAVSAHFPKLFADGGNQVIILTAADIYLESRPEWKWAFGRQFIQTSSSGEDTYSGVISTHRMDPRTWGLPYYGSLFYERVQKMVSRYIALGFYGLPLSSDPYSITYKNIGGVGDLDRLDGHIPIQ